MKLIKLTNYYTDDVLYLNVDQVNAIQPTKYKDQTGTLIYMLRDNSANDIT